MIEKEFYEKVANWDFSQIKYETIKKTKWDFYEEISKYTNENSLCLDLGTGGGEKILAMYPEVRLVIGTDFSSKMIQTANTNLAGSKRNDVRFAQMNNLKLKFPNGLFDVVTARHTVINACELYRVLKPKGIVIIQGVDKDDCLQLKKIFNRGQAFNDEKAISQIDYENLINSGFEIIKKVKIDEEEYYKTKEDLLALLLKTPILDDFSNSENNYDKIPIEQNLLDSYIKNNKLQKGIKLNRLLYGIVAQKK